MKEVFISYVRENSADVDRLAKALRAYEIAVWVDRDAIKPGTRWRDAIRHAIRDGAFFVACFSHEYFARSKTYMNEELTLAIDELRQRATDQAWFIPVLLSKCEIPDRAIGGGETLRSLQHVAMHLEWDEGLQRILSTIQPDSAALHKFESQLSDKSARVRIAAADRLAAMGGAARKVVPTLIPMLKDNNATVVRAAVGALEAVAGPTEETIEGLLNLMTYSDISKDQDIFYAIEAAAYSLTGFGVEALGPMLNSLRRNPDFEESVSRIITSIKDIKAIDILSNILLHELPQIRGAAALSLGHQTFDVERGRPGEFFDTSFPFEERFRPAHPSVLTKAGLVRALSDDFPFVRSCAARAIGEMGAHAADLRPELVRALNDPEFDVKQSAAFALGEIGDAPADALSVLVGLLPSGAAAFALGRMGERAKASVPVMLGHLRTADGHGAAEMVVALGRIGDPSAVATIVGCLKGSTGRQVRMAAASSLSHFAPTGEILESLDGIVCDPGADEYVLFNAATALGRFDPSKAVPTLLGTFDINTYITDVLRLTRWEGSGVGPRALYKT